MAVGLTQYSFIHPSPQRHRSHKYEAPILHFPSGSSSCLWNRGQLEHFPAVILLLPCSFARPSPPQHPLPHCSGSTCCVTEAWEYWARFYPWLCLFFFFQNLYLTSLALRGISQVRARVSAKGLGLHQEFRIQSPRMDLWEFVNVSGRPQKHVGLCGLFFFFPLRRVLSF